MNRTIFSIIFFILIGSGIAYLTPLVASTLATDFSINKIFTESDKLRMNGQYQEALNKMEGALKDSVKKYGEFGFYTGNSYYRIAYIYHQMGDFEKAEAAYEKAEDIFSRFNDYVDIRLYFTNDFGNLYFENADFEKAKQKYERVVNFMEWLPNYKSPIVGRLYSSLGQAELITGDSASAKISFGKALVLYDSIGNQKDGGKEAAWLGQAEIERSRGNLDKANSLCRKALASLKKNPDKNKPHIAALITDAKANLSIVTLQQGDIKASESLIADAQKNKIPGHFKLSLLDQIGSQCTVALNLVAQEKYPEAEQLLKETIKEFSKNKDIEQEYLITPYRILGEMYVKQEKYQEGKSTLEKTLKFSEGINIHPSNLLAILNPLAISEYRLGNYDKAEENYLKALKLCEGAAWPGADNAVSFVSANLAQLYSDMERYEKAEKHFQKALEYGKKSNEKKENMASITELMGEMYDNWGKNDQAEKAYLQNLEFVKEAYGDNSSEVADSLNSLGLFYESIVRFEDSEKMHKAALQIREKLFGSDSIECSYSYYNLGLLYESWEKIDLARPYYEKTLKIEEKILGKDHTDTKETRLTLKELGRK